LAFIVKIFSFQLFSTISTTTMQESYKMIKKKKMKFMLPELNIMIQ